MVLLPNSEALFSTVRTHYTVCGLKASHGVHDIIALSPFQSKVMPGYAKKFVFNGYRRLSAEAFYFLIPFATGMSPIFWYQLAVL